MIDRNSSLFLIANLGSEVSKIYSAKEKGDKQMLNSAMHKAKLILSELSAKEDKNPEIDILNEIVNDLALGNRKFNIDPVHLKSYFYSFAMRLMQS